MIISFFGHARFDGKEDYEKRILSYLNEWIGEQAAELYFGGYGDFDHLAYRCGKKYQATHPMVSLIFITPYMTISYQANHLKGIQKQYDDIVYPPIEDKPPKLAILYRNQWMVDQSDLIVFGIEHEWGGAYQTYHYAKGRKKRILNIAEKEL